MTIKPFFKIKNAYDGKKFFFYDKKTFMMIKRIYDKMFLR